MIKTLIALVALSTLSLHEVNASAASKFTEGDLLNHFRAIDGRVYVDSAFCRKNKNVLGMQLGQTVHICTSNHEGNHAAIKDTIRHEIWHVVQVCNNGPISRDPIGAIAVAHSMGWTGKGYTKPAVWHMEAEAHVAARLLTPLQIKQNLDRYCTPTNGSRPITHQPPTAA